MIRSMLRNTSAGIPPIELTDFLITVKTDNAGSSASNQFILPIIGTDYDVITSDGQYITGNTGDLTITFPIAGNYDVAVRGDFDQIFFNNSQDRLKLLDIKQWGNNAWTSMINAFYGCSNLTGSFTDNPNLSLVTNCSSMFLNCINFNGNISSWNVSNITNMSGMFRSCINFNQPLDSWNVSNVTLMVAMFRSASKFNQSLNSWNVSSVTSMAAMFYGASLFNGNITSWNVSSCQNFAQMFFSCTNFNQNISLWNLSNATTTFGMFQNCTNFNQNIGGWNVSNVATMASMFVSAIAFDQDISGWNISNVSNFSNFMLGKSDANYSAANLDAIYNGWSLLTLNSGVTIDFGTIKYTAAGQAGRDILTGAPNNWTITDGGI